MTETLLRRCDEGVPVHCPGVWLTSCVRRSVALLLGGGSPTIRAAAPKPPRPSPPPKPRPVPVVLTGTAVHGKRPRASRTRLRGLCQSPVTVRPRLPLRAPCRALHPLSYTRPRCGGKSATYRRHSLSHTSGRTSSARRTNSNCRPRGQRRATGTRHGSSASHQTPRTSRLRSLLGASAAGDAARRSDGAAAG